jgi:exonuclease VII large subunit
MILSAAAAVAEGERALKGLDSKVRDLAAQVSRGSLRQRDDHARDFGRALARLGGDRRNALSRGITRASEQLDREAVLVRDRSHRRLADAKRTALHAAALARAHDFRPRGWLLAEANGTPVRSAADLMPGRPVELHLHDGRAHAVVQAINHNPESRTS